MAGNLRVEDSTCLPSEDPVGCRRITSSYLLKNGDFATAMSPAWDSLGISLGTPKMEGCILERAKKDDERLEHAHRILWYPLGQNS